MRILIVGNMGYVGPMLVRELRARKPDATLIGLDAGFFAHCLTTPAAVPEVLLDQQIFADVRGVTALPQCDAVVYLAALSNDVLGSLNEDVTLAINHRAAIRFAELARDAGARAFVFASSCSVYGFAEDTPRTESSEVNPLTAYARSKILAERDLQPLATSDFAVTCLRFATACGMSDRLRLDLVLNDFVAAALTSGRIQILSDGTPWRPLIDVKDMARAMAWAIDREPAAGGAFLLANAGSDRWNFRVRELAEAVAGQIPGTAIDINTAAAPDRRSYRVDFSLFRELAAGDQPRVEIEQAVREIVAGLESIQFRDADFRQSAYMRIRTLNRLRAEGRLNEDLTWKRAL
ncbi:MAG: SDR family oxidoreductase [Acidobacteria bacterium]|nr:SDR family oxidoreductase [Acidobacteriota bacterium]